MTVNHLGDGLTVTITAGRLYSHDWMAFACWYSLSKMLPDARPVVLLPQAAGRRQVFAWPDRVGVKVVHAAPAGLTVPCHTALLREVSDGDVGWLNSAKNLTLTEAVCADAGAEIIRPFVSYERGCGNFVTAQWIHSLDCPFPLSDRLMTPAATPNEIKLLKLWKQVGPLYAAVSKS